MKIAIFGRISNHLVAESFRDMMAYLCNKEIPLLLSQDLMSFIETHNIYIENYEIFNGKPDLTDVEFAFSVGGDGTFLDTVTKVKDKNIPILGVNAGRLGFLATVPMKTILDAMDKFFNKQFSLDKRCLVEFKSSETVFGEFNCGLNEFGIHKLDTSSMIVVHTYIDGNFLNSYWADGLLVSTPTGSTAYSLSCGGPLVLPGSNNFVIAPINPHNLNVRPMVVPSSSQLTFKVEGRTENVLLSLDSQSKVVKTGIDMLIREAETKVNLIELEGTHFFDTLRKKLNWGLDVRN